jgi:hypothetical protein
MGWIREFLWVSDNQPPRIRNSLSLLVPHRRSTFGPGRATLRFAAMSANAVGNDPTPTSVRFIGEAASEIAG